MRTGLWHQPLSAWVAAPQQRNRQFLHEKYTTPVQVAAVSQVNRRQREHPSRTLLLPHGVATVRPVLVHVTPLAADIVARDAGVARHFRKGIF